MTGTSAGFGKHNDGAVMRVMGAAARTVGARHGIDGEQYYVLMRTMVPFLSLSSEKAGR